MSDPRKNDFLLNFIFNRRRETFFYIFDFDTPSVMNNTCAMSENRVLKLYLYGKKIRLLWILVLKKYINKNMSQLEP